MAPTDIAENSHEYGRRVSAALGLARQQIVELEARIRELENHMEQFARDIANKLGIPYEPPVAKGDCKYLVALEALKERLRYWDNENTKLDSENISMRARIEILEAQLAEAL